MGICISSESPEIHETEKHLMTVEENGIYCGFPKQSSVCSQPGSKGLNQDAVIFYQDYGMKDGAFCGVFDGHGANGHLVSNMVKNRLPTLLLSQKKAMADLNRSAVKGPPDSQNHVGEGDVEGKKFHEWREAMVGAFKVMDKEIKLTENLDCSCSGTTAVVAVRQGEDLVLANLGDSRAVLGRLDEAGVQAIQLTTDLKPGLPGEAERIRKCKGRVMALKEEPHIQRVWLPNEDAPGLAMSRAFGDFALKSHGIIALPDLSYHRLSLHDQFLVLATDGVWDVLSNEEVVAIVQTAGSEHVAAKAVVEAASAAWKSKFPASKADDRTVTCLFFHKQRDAAR